jgi:hypothetical protein
MNGPILMIFQLNYHTCFDTLNKLTLSTPNVVNSCMQLYINQITQKHHDIHYNAFYIIKNGPHQPLATRITIMEPNLQQHRHE